MNEYPKEAMMPDYAVVEMKDFEDNDEAWAKAWNNDDELSLLGEAHSADGRTTAFPLDPASLGTALLISVAANITTGALIAGIRALVRKSRPDDTFEVEVIHKGSSDNVIRIKVKQGR